MKKKLLLVKQEIFNTSALVYLLTTASIIFVLLAYLAFPYFKENFRSTNLEIMKSSLIPEYNIENFDVNDFLGKPREHFIAQGYHASHNSIIVKMLDGTIAANSITAYVSFNDEHKKNKFNSLYHLLDSLIMDGKYDDSFKILEFMADIAASCDSKDNCGLHHKFKKNILHRYYSARNFVLDLENYVLWRVTYPAIDYFFQGRYAESKWLTDKAWKISNKLSNYGKVSSPGRNTIIFMKMLLEQEDTIALNHAQISELINISMEGFTRQPNKLLFPKNENDYYYMLFLYWSGIALLNQREYEKAKKSFLNIVASSNNDLLTEFSYLLYLRSIYREIHETDYIMKTRGEDLINTLKKSLSLFNPKKLYYVRNDVNELLKKITKLDMAQDRSNGS